VDYSSLTAPDSEFTVTGVPVDAFDGSNAETPFTSTTPGEPVTIVLTLGPDADREQLMGLILDGDNIDSIEVTAVEDSEAGDAESEVITYHLYQ